MKTSESDPLVLDHVALPSGGAIAMTLCPGKRQPDASTGPWDRDLATDLRVIVEWGAIAVVTLMPAEELARLSVSDLGQEVEARGLEWYHLPIADFHAPDAAFEQRWLDAGPRLRTHLANGRRVVLHCRGGLGRAGTIAARLLIELGESPAAAIARVRAARPGTIETEAQERHLRALPAPPRGVEAIGLDRLLGCLIGGALGDALGYTVEFDTIAQIRARFGPEGLRQPVPVEGVFRVSNDTQMTLFTLEGVLRGWQGGRKPTLERLLTEIRRAYLDWLDTQRPGEPGGAVVGALARMAVLRQRRAPGHTCLQALERGGRGSRRSPINDSKGCGAAMREAPIGLLSALSADEVFDLGARTGALTHGHLDGWAPAAFVAATTWRLARGAALDTAIAYGLRRLVIKTPRARTIACLRYALDLAEKKPNDPVAAIHALGGGWTGDEAMAIAAYAVLTGADFPDVLARAANHDGDSDSTAAIAGQLWGARHGALALPHAWARRLDAFPAMLTLAAAARTARPPLFAADETAPSAA